VTTFRGRRAARLENGRLRVTVLAGGGHIAEISRLDQPVNPLWEPPWPSIEPGDYDPKRHPDYGAPAEARLLASIMGHNLCLDFFGPPSENEIGGGLTAHGEAPVVDWELVLQPDGRLRASAELPLSQIRVERLLRLAPGADVLVITETVHNLSSFDRPIGWTQHVTLGPPFVAPGRTTFQTTAQRSRVFEGDFGAGKGLQASGADFNWPHCPARHGGFLDLRATTTAPVSAGYTAHLMDPSREQAWFTAFHPDLRLVFGYLWRRADFPWLGIWEENHSREPAPWLGRTLTRGMEFGVSPMPETRRQMVERGPLFGAPTCLWMGAHDCLTVEYCAFLQRAEEPVTPVTWTGDEVITRAGHD